MREVVLASGNSGKIREFEAALAPLGIRIIPVGSLLPDWSVVEDGVSFFENARIKAESVARVTGFPALADDSGLNVYYLGGAPGIHSARFSGEGASDRENNQYLLELMRGAGKRRQAHFTAVLALQVPGQQARFSVGRLFGHILEAPRGDGGFGYDPLFEVRGANRTLAEMTIQEKNQISHRGQAIKAMSQILGGE